MSNERYLIVSYFFSAVVCLGTGVAAYRILRRPFAAIADAAVGSRSPVLKRALAASMTVAALLGFLGYSYNQKGCVSYEQVVKNRDLLIDANVRQVRGATVWIVWTVLAWGVVVVSELWLMRRRKARE